MLSGGVRAGSVKSIFVVEYRQYEPVQDIAAVKVVKSILHLVMQAPKKLGPVIVALIAGSVDYEAPNTMFVFTELPFNQIGIV